VALVDGVRRLEMGMVRWYVPLCLFGGVVEYRGKYCILYTWMHTCFCSDVKYNIVTSKGIFLPHMIYVYIHKVQYVGTWLSLYRYFDMERECPLTYAMLYLLSIRKANVKLPNPTRQPLMPVYHSTASSSILLEHLYIALFNELYT